MSGISGIVNPKTNIRNKKNMCEAMSGSLLHRSRGGSVKCADFENAVISAASNDGTPLRKTLDGYDYTLVYDGEIYNLKEIKDYIGNKFSLKGSESEAELILLLYCILGNGFLKKINGAFAIAIWNESSKELVLARDRFGIKPLYYAISGESIYFSSEIKGLLSSKDIEPVIKKDGLLHIFSIGPGLDQGNGIFSNVYELLPATLATYNEYGIKAFKYWGLESKRHADSPEETVEKVFKLTRSAIENQIRQNPENLCYFLSGGLDSSIITSLGAELSSKPINTFSVKYTGNDEFFTPNEFQPASDDYYIGLMSEIYSTNHTTIEISQQELFDLLGEAVVARDHPGMADIDSSLLAFCRKIGMNYENAMSGECADEVFGGYPWFHKKELLNADTFPWSVDTELRENLINKKIACGEDIKNYISLRYRKSIAETPIFGGDNAEEKRRREISHLNLNWFMYSLGARSERIGMYNNLNIRMPFCDYKLVEYVWNIPWSIKAMHGREKGLLREAFKNKLPEEIFERKKSPFPKTHNPLYEKLTRERLAEILSGDTVLKQITDTDYINKLLKEKSDYAKPWFGQLMALPQLFAYLIQIDFWFRKYKIKLEI